MSSVIAYEFSDVSDGNSPPIEWPGGKGNMLLDGTAVNVVATLWWAPSCTLKNPRLLDIPLTDPLHYTEQGATVTNASRINAFEAGEGFLYVQVEGTALDDIGSVMISPVDLPVHSVNNVRLVNSTPVS